MTRFLVQSRVFLGNQHAMWSKQHNGKVSPRQLWRDLSHLSAHSRYTTIGDAGARCVLEVSPLQLNRSARHWYTDTNAQAQILAVPGTCVRISCTLI